VPSQGPQIYFPRYPALRLRLRAGLSLFRAAGSIFIQSMPLANRLRLRSAARVCAFFDVLPHRTSQRQSECHSILPRTQVYCIYMENVQVDRAELLARKVVLEERIEGYKASMAAVNGPCSKSSLRRQLDECEMALEQIREELGEI
jgi:hypothetical protein